ncbi:MAG: hypothetical protein RL095_3125 [Verrucomicrobiota bacterium]|jgi:hypothetical protein
MNQIFTVARMVFRMLTRRGVLLSLLLVCALVGGVIFLMPERLGTPGEDLRIRLLYSLTLSSGFVSLVTLCLACFGIRAQLDAKNLHLMDTLPLSRSRTWLGQWLGYSAAAVLMQAAALAGIAGAVLLHLRVLEPVARQVCLKQVLEVRAEARPIVPPDLELVKDFCRRHPLKWEGKPVDLEYVDKRSLYELFGRAADEIQNVAAGKTGQWRFDLAQGRSVEGMEIEFQAQGPVRDKAVKGEWHLLDSTGTELWRGPSEFPVWSTQRLAIPAGVTQETRLTLRFHNLSTQTLTFQRHSGLALRAPQSSLWPALLSAFAAASIHLGVAVAIGLCCGTALTFSVAAFSSIVLFSLGLIQPFFREVIEDFRFAMLLSWDEKLTLSMLNVCTYLTRGLESPAWQEALAAGIAPPNLQIWQEWLPMAGLYGVGAALLGCLVLERKELDCLQV